MKDFPTGTFPPETYDAMFLTSVSHTTLSLPIPLDVRVLRQEVLLQLARDTNNPCRGIPIALAHGR